MMLLVLPCVWPPYPLLPLPACAPHPPSSLPPLLSPHSVFCVVVSLFLLPGTTFIIVDAVAQKLWVSAFISIFLWLAWHSFAFVAMLKNLPSCFSLTLFNNLAYIVLLAFLSFATYYSYDPMCRETSIAEQNPCDAVRARTPVTLIAVQIMLPHVSGPALGTNWLLTAIGAIFYLVITLVVIVELIPEDEAWSIAIMSVGNLAAVA